MFSTAQAPASSRVLSILCLIALCLVLTPQIAEAQTTESDDDPPPIMYVPDTTTEGLSTPKSFICRTPFDDSSGSLFCAGEFTFGDSTTINVTGEAATYTFVLASHESVTIETFGSLDTFGELLDVNGQRVAANDDGGIDQNFHMTRTLTPGRYYIHVTNNGGPSAAATLRITHLRPFPGIGPAAGLTEDVGNHCGRAAEIASFSSTASTFDRPGDIDVFALELTEASDLLIDIDASARYELKAANCMTSLGLANSALGATLASLPKGRYYLYVSQPDRLTGDYELRVELR